MGLGYYLQLDLGPFHISIRTHGRVTAAAPGSYQVSGMWYQVYVTTYIPGNFYRSPKGEESGPALGVLTAD